MTEKGEKRVINPKTDPLKEEEIKAVLEIHKEYNKKRRVPHVTFIAMGIRESSTVVISTTN